MTEYKFHVERQPWRSGVSLAVARPSPTATGELEIAHLEYTPHPPGFVAVPCMSLSLNSAQELMNELWAAGIRPSDDIGTAGHLSAMKAHLEDMRRLAMHSVPQLPAETKGAW